MTLDISMNLGHIMTSDCRDDKDSKKKSGGKMQLAVCWLASQLASSHLHLLMQKCVMNDFVAN